MQVFEDTLSPQTQELYEEWPAKGCITTEHHPKGAARPTSPTVPTSRNCSLMLQGAALKGSVPLLMATQAVSGSLARAEPKKWSSQPREALLVMCEAPAQSLCPNSPWTSAWSRSWSTLCAELQFKLRHGTKIILPKTPLEMLTSTWKAERGMDLGKRRRGRLTGRHLFQWLWVETALPSALLQRYSIQPSSTGAHQILISIVSSRVRRASGAHTLADYACTALWERRTFLACWAVKVVMRTWGTSLCSLLHLIKTIYYRRNII